MCSLQCAACSVKCNGAACSAVRDKYDFQAQIQIYIYIFFFNYKYIPVDIFWLIQIGIYLGPTFLEKFKYILVYQKWVNMNTNTIIWIDICEYKYYHTQNEKFICLWI